MSSTDGSVGPPPLERALPLRLLERHLGPIRRVAGYAARHPGHVRYLEINTRRWLGPLLEEDLPDFVRQSLIVLAGQVAGVDRLDEGTRANRMAVVHQEVRRLDAVLGLPLPPAEPQRPAPEPKVDARTFEEPRRERQKTKKERKERHRAAEPVDRKAVQRPFWNGNPQVAIADLDVAPTLVEALERAGIRTVHELLDHPPVGERIFRPIHGAGREMPEEEVAVGGRLLGYHTVVRPSGNRELRGTVRGADRMRLAWSDPVVATRFRDAATIGQRVVMVGRWDGSILWDAEVVAEDGKQVRRVYYGIPGVDDAEVQALVFRLLPAIGSMRDPLPAGIRRADHVSHGEALLALHGRGDREAARRRLAFEELLGLALGACYPRFSERRRGIAQTVHHEPPSLVLSQIDHVLPDPAELAFDAIRRDLRRSSPMRRLLAGPPGGSKALVALLASLAVTEGKLQVLWILPDAQLAENHHAFTTHLLEPTETVAELWRPGQPGASAQRERLKRGEIQLLFATPEVLGAQVEFRRLGLVVIVDRGGALDLLPRVEELRGPTPDLLVVSGYRPTSRALIEDWGSYAISWVDGPPAPQCLVKPMAQRDAAYAPARHAIQQGGQVAILFPQIAGRDALDPAEASRVLSAISADALAGARLLLLHGAMPVADRVHTWDDLSHRRAAGVVATLPLEDLPPIPGLKVVVVEHAHRVDPRRLTRIAGMGAQPVSLVVADDTPDERVRTLVEAVEGTPTLEPLRAALRFFDPATDGERILQAREAALELLARDGSLRNGAHADLVRLVRSRWARWFGSDAACPLPPPTDGPKRRRRRRRRR